MSLIREFVDAVRHGRPLVKQMLMGGGKTTVVGPLLALLLGDGETLVVQTMPPALLEQSKATLRATFSSIVRKRVFTLSFDRSSEMRWATVDKLKTAARNRGVVLCTAATIKSLQLKLLEKLDAQPEWFNYLAAFLASACSTAAASSSTTPPFSTAARASATAAPTGV